MDGWVWILWLVFVFAVSFGLRTQQHRLRRKPRIEFKCLEHMCALDMWDDGNYLWRCPHEECDAVVDPEVRWLYERVHPPK